MGTATKLLAATSNGAQDIVSLEDAALFFYVRLREQGMPQRTSKYVSDLLGNRFLRGKGEIFDEHSGEFIGSINGAYTRWIEQFAQLRDDFVQEKPPIHSVYSFAQSAGDFCLAMSGCFADGIVAQAETNLSALQQYEFMGANFYAHAASELFAGSEKRLLEGLSREFHQARALITSAITATAGMRVPGDATLRRIEYDGNRHEYGTLHLS